MGIVMKVGKISKRDIKYLNEFITKIYKNYKIEYDLYITRAISTVGDRLDHILDFINTWSRNVMDIANEYDVIRNIITTTSDISVHKDGRYTMLLKLLIVFKMLSTVKNLVLSFQFIKNVI